MLGGQTSIQRLSSNLPFVVKTATQRCPASNGWGPSRAVAVLSYCKEEVGVHQTTSPVRKLRGGEVANAATNISKLPKRF